MVFVVKSVNNGCTSDKVSVNGDDALSANLSLAVFTYFSFVWLSSLTLMCNYCRCPYILHLLKEKNIKRTGPPPPPPEKKNSVASR